MAELSRIGREFFHWPIEDAPDDVVAWDALIEGEWHPMSREGDDLVLLLQGPDVEVADDDAVTLTRTADITIRATDHPEVIPRPGGTIRLI
jgi:hypothetical protein